MARIDVLQLRRVTLVNQLALGLELGTQQAVLHRKRLIGDQRRQDALLRKQPLIHRLDVPPQRIGLRIRRRSGKDRRDEGLAGAVEHALLYARVLAQPLLYRPHQHIAAIGHRHDVVDAAMDVQEAVLVQVADIPGLDLGARQKALLVDAGVAPGIAAIDRVTAGHDQDAVLVEAHRLVRQHLAHAAQTEGARMVFGDDAGFIAAIAFIQRHPGLVEEFQDGSAGRRRAGPQIADAAAERGLDLRAARGGFAVAVALPQPRAQLFVKARHPHHHGGRAGLRHVQRAVQIGQGDIVSKHQR
ncbi:hypothetical protein LQT98_18240, partial [Chromobacterium aquaticum]